MIVGKIGLNSLCYRETLILSLLERIILHDNFLPTPEFML